MCPIDFEQAESEYNKHYAPYDDEYACIDCEANNIDQCICEGEDDGRKIRVNVGSGLSDSNRDEYWVNRDSLHGNLVEVEADAVTQNQDGSYSLRFPRFVRFRSFEAGEKI